MGKQTGEAMSRSNKTGLICYGIMNAILLACYLIEVVKGSRTIGYYAIFAILDILPFASSYIYYKRNSEDVKIGYNIAGGFFVFYLFIIFTTTSPVAYVYAMLIAAVLIAFNDNLLTLLFAIGVTLGNIVQVVVLAIRHQLLSEDLPNIEIRLASVVLFSMFVLMVTNTAHKNNEAKLIEIQNEKDNVARLLEQIMQVSSQMTENIQTATGKISTLEESVLATKDAMQEVSQGTGETAESIQRQMEKTEQIQKTIEKVTNVSKGIGNDMEDTKQQLDISKRNIGTLIEQVAITNETSESVSKELAELSEYTDQMQSIIELINGVTTQTSLLSLNASIEAARAGEAGRGFAVVASEISNLATQTQQATVEITSLISNISNELSEVVSVINRMIENARTQNVAAEDTARSFDVIHSKTDNVYAKAQDMVRLVGDLSNANSVIVASIETISATTEEVTAHSSETFESSEENGQIASEVVSIIEEINQMAQQLQEAEGNM